MYVYRQPREHIHVSMCIYLSALVLARKQVILVGKLVLHIGVTPHTPGVFNDDSSGRDKRLLIHTYDSYLWWAFINTVSQVMYMRVYIKPVTHSLVQ